MGFVNQLSSAAFQAIAELRWYEFSWLFVITSRYSNSSVANEPMVTTDTPFRIA